ncbi:MAG: hypothetical protein QM776_09265 [Rhodocyclaceae bacterium]
MSGLPVRFELCRPAALSARVLDEVWALTETFYDTPRELAEAKLLKGRGEVALMRAGGELVGMALVEVIVTRAAGGREVVAIFTSQTLIDARYRGRNLLQRLGLRVFLRERWRHPFSELVWFFDTFSYRSYLLLPRNFSVYWPRHDRETPRREQALMDALARQCYGEDWQAARGVVHRSPQRCLRGGVATPSVDDVMANAHLRFFVERNPEHAAGDMLVCLCPLTLRNWLVLGAKALWRSLRRAMA